MAAFLGNSPAFWWKVSRGQSVIKLSKQQRQRIASAGLAFFSWMTDTFLLAS